MWFRYFIWVYRSQVFIFPHVNFLLIVHALFLLGFISHKGIEHLCSHPTLWRRAFAFIFLGCSFLVVMDLLSQLFAFVYFIIISICGFGVGGGSYSSCWVCHLEYIGLLGAVVGGKENWLIVYGQPQVLKFKFRDGKKDLKTDTFMTVDMINGMACMKLSVWLYTRTFCHPGNWVARSPNN